MSFLKLNSKYCKLTPEQRLYNIDRPIIGLTGGIATGKSTASSILKSLGAGVIDADALVKEIYKNKETKIIVSELAPEALNNDEIDFKKLRERFFNDPIVKSKLENHIYSKLPNQFLKAMSAIPKDTLLIYDVPLLFEKGINNHVDLSVVVYVPESIQTKRLTRRDNINEELAKNIISNQMPIETKKELADFVLDNTGSLAELKAGVLKLFKEILGS